MIGYVEHFNSNKTMSFKVTDNKLLKKYTKIWERVNSLMNIEFDSETVYVKNDKYIKTKIKSYGDKINTNFQGKKIPKEDASYALHKKPYFPSPGISWKAQKTK